MQQEKLRIPAILQNGQRTQKTKKFFGRIFSKRRDLKIPNSGEAEKEAGARPGLPKAEGRRPGPFEGTALEPENRPAKKFFGRIFSKRRDLKSSSATKPKKQGPGRVC